jgi:hypothetical protein
MIEAVRTSETSVDNHFTRQYIPEDNSEQIPPANTLKLKQKIKLSHYGHAGTKGERKYSFYSFLISPLNGVSGQRHAPATFYCWRKDPQYQLGRRLGGL